MTNYLWALTAYLFVGAVIAFGFVFRGRKLASVVCKSISPVRRVGRGKYRVKVELK